MMYTSENERPSQWPSYRYQVLVKIRFRSVRILIDYTIIFSSYQFFEHGLLIVGRLSLHVETEISTNNFIIKIDRVQSVINKC